MTNMWLDSLTEFALKLNEILWELDKIAWITAFILFFLFIILFIAERNKSTSRQVRWDKRGGLHRLLFYLFQGVIFVIGYSDNQSPFLRIILFVLAILIYVMSFLMGKYIFSLLSFDQDKISYILFLIATVPTFIALGKFNKWLKRKQRSSFMKQVYIQKRLQRSQKK